MDKKIKNLFQQEEWIVLNLHNCAYQVKLYTQQLKEINLEYSDKLDKKEFNRFKKIFRYYKTDLIPAIQELAKLEQKHLNLIIKNPDPQFTPILEEFQFHKTLMNKFIHRFEEIHAEFYHFCQALKHK